MPFLRADDIQIYYEIHGAGPHTLTMIRGLGSSLTAWYGQVPEFSRHFQTVVFDNRGSGRTDKPDSPYSTRQMASDVHRLMESLNIRRTALLGVSMGGMIAQEFAIHYPEKLNCLILGCTSFGGPESIPIPQEAFHAILTGGSTERAMYSDQTISSKHSVIETFNQARGKFPTPPFALARQAAAIQEHDAAGRIGQIRVPTLVITGMEDRLIPPENSKLIAARIPGAVLKELPGGHLFTVEHPDLFNREVIDFLKRHSS
jgi:pimeloyl-ACP methyl ester carboxylesterase